MAGSGGVLMFASINQHPGPALPDWFLLPASVLFALITAYWIARTPGRAGRYLLFACYVRFTLGAFHEYTYQEVIPGLRWVALGSIFLIVTGMLVLDTRRLLSRPFLPVGVICLVMVASAIINKDLAEAIDPILRFLFFVLTAVAVWQALETNGPGVLRRLLFIFVQPIVFQAVSLALDLPKSGELDGSLSYIGGYYHEELFSLILVTAFLVAILASRLNGAAKAAVLLSSIIGIYLTNYRTSMVAALPLAIAAALSALPSMFRTDQRVLVRLTIIVVGCSAIIFSAGITQDRFSDLAKIPEIDRLIKPPEQYTYEDQRVLSARPFIWSQYITAYHEAPLTQKIIGYGPDAWSGKFPLYAHNTVISFLYEIGIIGVVALLWLWASMLKFAVQAEPRYRTVLIAGHLAFFLLNMATMPHWQIEGNIFYGILCGFTIAKARVAKAQLPSSRPRPDTHWSAKRVQQGPLNAPLRFRLWPNSGRQSRLARNPSADVWPPPVLRRESRDQTSI